VVDPVNWELSSGSGPTAHILDAEPRQRNAPAGALQAVARLRVAVATREPEAAVETCRWFDNEDLGQVSERSLQVLQMVGNVAFPNADDPRQVTSCDWPVQ
jgi:hypothetical protein